MQRTIKYSLLLSILLMSTRVLEAQTVTGLAALDGTWVLNKDKSDAGWNFAPGTWTWVIKVENNKISIAQDYPPRSIYQDCELILYSDNSGETNPNCFEDSPAEAESKTIWKKDKLVREYQTIRMLSGSAYKKRLKETFSISKSGRMVFERNEYADPPLINAGAADTRVHESVYVVIRVFEFDRQK